MRCPGILQVDLGVEHLEIVNAAGKFAWGTEGLTLPLGLAYNDPIGQWKLVVTDIATGMRAEKPFAVAK